MRVTYEHLYYTRSYSDLKFIVNGEVVPVHKCILSSKSTYFATMLFGMTNEAQMDTIELQVDSMDVFEQVLRFFYIGNLSVEYWDLDDLLSLLALSHEYLYSDVTDAVQHKITAKHVSLESFSPLYEVGLKYGLTALKQVSIEFAEKYAAVVIGNKQIFGRLSRDLLDTLMDCDCYAKAGETILVAIMSWHDLHARENCTLLLLKIHWESFTRKTLTNLVVAAISKVDFIPEVSIISYPALTLKEFTL